MMRLSFNLLMALSLGACASQATQPNDDASKAASRIVCQDPRPQICTMDYSPVCGELTDGGSKTFSNGCGACAVSNVDGYTPGECPAL